VAELKEGEPLIKFLKPSEISDLSEEDEYYQCPTEAVLLAWLLKHPAKIQPVLGTSRPDRLRACEGGFDFFKPRRMVLSLCRSPGRAYALKFVVTLPGRC
jgi:hypothetical protein